MGTCAAPAGHQSTKAACTSDAEAAAINRTPVQTLYVAHYARVPVVPVRTGYCLSPALLPATRLTRIRWTRIGGPVLLRYEKLHEHCSMQFES